MERSELRETPKRVGRLGLAIAAIALTFAAPVAVPYVEAAVTPEPQQLTLSLNQIREEQPTPTPEAKSNSSGSDWWLLAPAGAAAMALVGAVALRRASR